MVRFLVFSAVLATAALFYPPVIALAQGVPDSAALPTTGSEWLSLLIKAVVVPLIALAGQALWGWIQNRRGDDALGRLMKGLDVIGQPIWDRQIARVQVALADGKITAAEKAELLAGLTAELPNLVSRDTLALAMKALGVPDIGGVASWVLSKLLARWKGAHDPTDYTVPGSVTGIYPTPAVDPQGVPLPTDPSDVATRPSGG